MQRRGAWTAVWAPISLALCAAEVEKEGMTAGLKDCIIEDIGFEELKSIISDFRPDLVVINTATPSIDSDLSTAGVVKEIDSRIVTAAIGIHVTALPEDCLKDFPDLDFVVRGEPEEIVRELALALRDKRPAEEVAGLSFLRQGKIVHNPEQPFIEPLDNLPFPAWHLVDIKRYTMPFTGKPFLLVATSRGCPYRCTFCADKTFYGTRLRLKSPGRVVDEMEWVGKEFGIRDFLFWSESFTIKKEFAYGVSKELIKRGLKINWVCNSRVDNVDLELLRTMKKAGCWLIGYGIESGNQAVLDSVHKGCRLEDAKKAVRLTQAAGIGAAGHIVLGFPGETKETIEQTIRFAIELDLDFAQFYCAVPFPGSKLCAQVRQKGWINTDDWSRFEQNFSVLDTPQLKAEEVMRLRRLAFRRYYLRPRAVYKTLKRIRNLRQFFNFLAMLKDFVTWI